MRAFGDADAATLLAASDAVGLAFAAQGAIVLAR